MKRLPATSAIRILSAIALAASASAAWAQTAPANDNWANATAINNPASPTPLTTATPYTSLVSSLDQATVEGSDPLITCKNPAFSNPSAPAISAAEVQTSNSVWYTYTTGASVEYVNLKAVEQSFNVSSLFDTVISVWTGTPQSGFRMVTGGCNDDGIPFGTRNNFSRIAGLRLQPDTTYSIMVSFNPAGTLTSTPVLKFDMAVATQIAVNTTDDAVPIIVSSWPTPPAVTGNPCLDPALAASNTCSLRAAVETAAILGEQSPDAVTGVNGAAILIPAGTYPLSVYPSPSPSNDNGSQNVGGGDIDLFGSMAIYGAGMGQTIIIAPNGGASAGQYHRAFGVQTPTFNGNAAVPGITSSFQRFQRINTIIADVTLQGPGPAAATFSPPPTAPNGGGLFSTGNGAFTAFQRVEFNGGYSVGDGGAIAAGNPLQIRDSKFINNSAMPLSVNATGAGGAISVAKTGDFQYLGVSGSTFTGNFAASEAVSSTNVNGGGAITAQGFLVLTNSTLTGNSTNGYGGAIVMNRINGGEPVADIRNSTITDNIADVDTDGIGVGGGIYLDAASSANSPASPSPTTPALPTSHLIVNSIVADNAVGTDSTGVNSNCAATPYAIGAPQVLLGATYNLTNVIGTGVCNFSGAGNIVAADAMLDALADNGGPTPTIALQPASPAVDGGDPAGCFSHAGPLLATDQRGSGFARPTGARCDIGAFELTTISAAPGAPQLTAASDTGDSSSDGLTTIEQPTFTGSCGTDGDTVSLLDAGIDAGSGTCNAGTYTISVAPALSEGSHAISAFESNASGPSPQSAATTITIDVTGPTIDLISTPPALETGSQDAEFMFSVGEGRLSTAQCTMDGASVGDDNCNTGDATYYSLASGEHTFAVTATDAAGATTTKQYTWQIGLAGKPATPVLAAASDSGSSNADGITNADPLEFQDSCTTGDSMMLYDDTTVVAGPIVCASGTVSFSIAALAEGVHPITITATRGSGAESAHSNVRSVTVDRTAPMLVIDSGPMANMVSTSATFTFHVDDTSSVQCQLDTNAFAACTSPQTYNSLALGAHTFTIASTDTAGNVATPQVANWTVIQPSVSGAPMLSPDSDSGISNSDGITNAHDTLFVGACTDGDSIQLYDGATMVGSATLCASGTYNITLSALTEGTHQIAMTATRNSIESAMSAAAAVQIDRTAPNAPAISGNTGPANLTATLYGLAEPASTVQVRDGGTFVCSGVTNGAANWNCSGSLAGSGTRPLQATATDVAGNVSTASAQFDLTVTGNDRVFGNGFE